MLTNEIIVEGHCSNCPFYEYQDEQMSQDCKLNHAIQFYPPYSIDKRSSLYKGIYMSYADTEINKNCPMLISPIIVSLKGVE